MPALLVLIIGGSILTIGDIVFKFYANKPHWALYATGLGIYLIGLMFLVKTFESENIAVASTIFVIANIITLSIVSWLYFGEKLSSLQLLGLGVAIVAILLLELGS